MRSDARMWIGATPVFSKGRRSTAATPDVSPTEQGPGGQAVLPWPVFLVTTFVRMAFLRKGPEELGFPDGLRFLIASLTRISESEQVHR
jgi:hypothetical protein